MTLTVYLARLFGLSCLLMCGVFVTRPKGSLAAITEMMERPGALLVTGIATMTAGAAAVIGHNLWRGDVLTIVVTALSWLTLIKGFAILAAPPPLLASFYRWMGYPARFRLVMAIAAAGSLVLTLAAFTATPTPAP